MIKNDWDTQNENERRLRLRQAPPIFSAPKAPNIVNDTNDDSNNTNLNVNPLHYSNINENNNNNDSNHKKQRSISLTFTQLFKVKKMRKHSSKDSNHSDNVIHELTTLKKRPKHTRNNTPPPNQMKNPDCDYNISDINDMFSNRDKTFNFDDNNALTLLTKDIKTIQKKRSLSLGDINYVKTIIDLKNNDIKSPTLEPEILKIPPPKPKKPYMLKKSNSSALLLGTKADKNKLKFSSLNKSILKQSSKSIQIIPKHAIKLNTNNSDIKNDDSNDTNKMQIKVSKPTNNDDIKDDNNDNNGMHPRMKFYTPNTMINSDYLMPEIDFQRRRESQMITDDDIAQLTNADGLEDGFEITKKELFDNDDDRSISINDDNDDDTHTRDNSKSQLTHVSKHPLALTVSQTDIYGNGNDNSNNNNENSDGKSDDKNDDSSISELTESKIDDILKDIPLPTDTNDDNNDSLNPDLQIDSGKNKQLWTQIMKDVNRTFQYKDFFREKKTKTLLGNILYVWSRLHDDVGYFQGMHDLASIMICSVLSDYEIYKNELGILIYYYDIYLFT